MRAGKARVLTPAEVNDRLLPVVAAGRNGERNVAIMMLSFGLGLRVGEIAALDVQDVLNEDGTIKRSTWLKQKNSRTKKHSRELFIENEKVRKALEAYISHLLTMGDVHMDAPLFKSQKGKRFTANSLQQRIAKMFKRAGLDGCKSHSGRRSFATTLIARNTDIKAVSTLMGHATVKQTAEYVETSPETLKKAASKAI